MNSQEERRTARRKMMLEGNLYKVVPIVAVPMIITMMVDGLYNMADAYFVSKLGLAATAAVGVNDAMLNIIRAVALGFGIGSSSYISRLMGAKQEDEAARVAVTSLITAMITNSVLAVVAFIFRNHVVILLGATEASKTYAIEYISYVLISAPITAGEVGLSQILRGEGSTVYSMIGMTSGCIINCALDPLLISVFDMGVAGAAIATTVSKFIGLIILLIPFIRGKSMLELKLSNFTPKKAMYKEIARMGIPSFLRSSIFSVSSILTNRVAGSFSDACLAGSTVATKCCRLVASAIMGYGQGLQPVAGYCWGAKKYKRAGQAFWAATIMGAIAAVILGTVMIILAPRMVLMFADESETEAIRIAVLMIRTQCITMFAHTWVMIINGLFTALGKAVPAGFLALSRQGLVLVPCILILPKIFGLNGFACSQAVADVLSLAIAIPLVLKQMKEIDEKENESADISNIGSKKNPKSLK